MQAATPDSRFDRERSNQQSSKPSIPVASLALFGLFLIAHVLAFLLKWHTAFLDIALQLFLLLPAMVVGLRPAIGSGRLPQVPGWILWAAAIVFLIGGFLANQTLAFGRLGGDEWAYRFQGQILSTGHVSALAPPVPAYFEHHIVAGGRWFTKFPPGFPAILALAGPLRMIMVVNVLLGLGIFAFTFLTASMVYSKREAGIAAALLIFSPYFFCNCLGILSHPFCGFLLSCATYFYFRGVRPEGRSRDFAVMLFCIGISICVRPLTGALFGVILCSAAVWTLRKDRLRLTRLVALCLLFGILTVGVNAAYNKATTGRYSQFPYAMFMGSAVPEEIQPTGEAIIQNMKLGPSSLWEFAFPLLPVAALFAVWREREKRSEAIVLAALVVSLVIGYTPNRWGWGTVAGDRFFFEFYFALALLGARGLRLWLRERDAAPRIARYLWPLAAVSLVATFSALQEMNGLAAPYVKVRNQIAAGPTLHNGVVFMTPNEPDFYPKHINLNNANWPAEPVFYAPDPGPAERETYVRALGRSCWEVVGYDESSRRATLSNPSCLSPTP